MDYFLENWQVWCWTTIVNDLFPDLLCYDRINQERRQVHRGDSSTNIIRWRRPSSPPPSQASGVGRGFLSNVKEEGAGVFNSDLNCSARGHLATDCQKLKQERRCCVIGGLTQHQIVACLKKQSGDKSTNVVEQVTVTNGGKIDEDQVNVCPILDTSSSISLLTAS